MGRPDRLSASFVNRVHEPGRYSDGRGAHGLSLLVRRRASGGRLSKTFSQRITIRGRATNLGLGVYPIVTLAEAREKALANKIVASKGGDPRGSTAVPTLAEAAEALISLQAPGWSSQRSADQWRSSLEQHAYPMLGRRPVDAITSNELHACLAKIWTAKPETAKRLLQRLNKIMQWAVTKGHRSDNPALNVAAGLPYQNTDKRPHRAAHHTDLPELLRTVRESPADTATRLAFEMIALTAVRSGEARMAKWCEFDLDSATWTIPAERMKTRRAHRVPLSRRALELLDQAKSLCYNDRGELGHRGEALVFPSVRTGRPLSDNTLGKLARDLELPFVPHGLRSSFRDWCGESGVPRELAERALAHVVPGTEGAYARSDLLERRRPIMEDWAHCLMSSEAAGAGSESGAELNAAR